MKYIGLITLLSSLLTSGCGNAVLNLEKVGPGRFLDEPERTVMLPAPNRMFRSGIWGLVNPMNCRIAIAPDGHEAAICGDGYIRIVDTNSWATRKEFNIDGCCLAISYLPMGQKIAFTFGRDLKPETTGSGDWYVGVINCDSGEVTFSVRAHSHPAYQVFVSASGDIVSVSNQDVVFHSAHTGSELRRISAKSLGGVVVSVRRSTRRLGSGEGWGAGHP